MPKKTEDPLRLLKEKYGATHYLRGPFALTFPPGKKPSLSRSVQEKVNAKRHAEEKLFELSTSRSTSYSEDFEIASDDDCKTEETQTQSSDNGMLPAQETQQLTGSDADRYSPPLRNITETLRKEREAWQLLLSQTP